MLIDPAIADIRGYPKPGMKPSDTISTANITPVKKTLQIPSTVMVRDSE